MCWHEDANYKIGPWFFRVLFNNIKLKGSESLKHPPDRRVLCLLPIPGQIHQLWPLHAVTKLPSTRAVIYRFTWSCDDSIFLGQQSSTVLLLCFIVQIHGKHQGERHPRYTGDADLCRSMQFDHVSASPHSGAAKSGRGRQSGCESPWRAKDWVKFSAPAKTHSRQLKRALLIFQALLLEFKFEERSLNESSLCSSGPYDLSMLGHLLTHLNSSSGTFPCSSSICDVWSFSSFIWTAKKFVCCLYFSMSLTWANKKVY